MNDYDMMLAASDEKMQAKKWKADPKRGHAFVEPRRQQIVDMLMEAADVAYFALDEKLKADIEALQKTAAEKKSSISKTVEQAQSKPAMEIVRKYWNESPDNMWKQFVHNMSEGSGKA